MDSVTWNVKIHGEFQTLRPLVETTWPPSLRLKITLRFIDFVSKKVIFIENLKEFLGWKFVEWKKIWNIWWIYIQPGSLTARPWKATKGPNRKDCVPFPPFVRGDLLNLALKAGRICSCCRCCQVARRRSANRKEQVPTSELLGGTFPAILRETFQGLLVTSNQGISKENSRKQVILIKWPVG